MNLEELLKTAIDDPDYRKIFLQTLIRSEIFIICRNPVQKETANQAVQLELVTVQNPENEVLIPFFTSHRELQHFAGQYVECCKMNCLRFFDLVQEMGAVLNPNSYGKEFSSEEIKSILRISRNQHIEPIIQHKFDTFRYRKPEGDFTQLTKSASKFFSTQPNVDRAFLLEMQKGGEKPKLLIVVDMLGNTRKLFVALARHLAKTADHAHLYFLSYEQELAKKAVADIEPFYIRNTKRYFQR